ncbi:uncharacterized protein C8Q71DRAFT_569758 [Rhodofomes roseus]|uniref:Uncharacterized protein n=1 Tax=Rhodofomes roseus TaxID=34475 RepID=A0ABQ8KK20_9APHY|nr:uncharacterized protein C8Q71DRAFT_569758 [Rhodofomes roseus]KAH9837937.1 hypothetical protein C8Q71DRAFT_569758 [Rhodofomes roseus]
MFCSPDKTVAASVPLPTADVPAGRWSVGGRAGGWVDGGGGPRGSGEGPLCSGERFDGNLLSPFVDRSHLPPQRPHPLRSLCPPSAPPAPRRDWPHGAPDASMPPLRVDEVSLLLFDGGGRACLIWLTSRREMFRHEWWPALVGAGDAPEEREPGANRLSSASLRGIPEPDLPLSPSSTILLPTLPLTVILLPRLSPPSPLLQAVQASCRLL